MICNHCRAEFFGIPYVCPGDFFGLHCGVQYLSRCKGRFCSKSCVRNHTKQRNKI